MNKELSFKQWHHGYLGIALCLIGGLGHKTLFLVLGGILVIDDVLEHSVQFVTKSEWHSPLRRLYTIFYVRIGWVRAVNAWLDRVVIEIFN